PVGERESSAGVTIEHDFERARVPGADELHELLVGEDADVGLPISAAGFEYGQSRTHSIRFCGRRQTAARRAFQSLVRDPSPACLSIPCSVTRPPPDHWGWTHRHPGELRPPHPAGLTHFRSRFVTTASCSVSARLTSVPFRPPPRLP